MSQNPLEFKLANSKSLYAASPIHSHGDDIKGSCLYFLLPFCLLMDPVLSCVALHGVLCLLFPEICGSNLCLWQAFLFLCVLPHSLKAIPGTLRTPPAQINSQQVLRFGCGNLLLDKFIILNHFCDDVCLHFRKRGIQQFTNSCKDVDLVSMSLKACLAFQAYQSLPVRPLIPQWWCILS